MAEVTPAPRGTSTGAEAARDRNLAFLRRLLSRGESIAKEDELNRNISLDCLLRHLMDSTHNDFELVRKFSAHPDYASFFWKEIAREYLSVEPGREQIPMWNDEVFSSGHGTTKDKLQFMKDVKINACYYLVDRNIEMGLGNKPALYYVPRNWEKDGTKTIQYNELKEEVCIVSNVILRILEGSGGTGGETAPCVVIYLPDYPQLVYVILACFRLGYVPIVAYRAHDISMLNRIVEECKPKLAVTADIACNNAPGGENSMAVILIKTLKSSGKNNDCFVLLMDPGIRSDEMLLQQRGDYLLPRTELDDHFDHDRHFWYREISQSVPKDHQYDTFEANNPLFYACTSGSTGSPKIVEHRTLGYLLNVVVVFKFMHLFQVNGPPSASIQQDVSFCLPTLAWLYGMHSLLLGPLLTGGATVLYEHDVSESKMVKNVRQLIEKMKVTHLFTVPRFLNSFVRHATSRRVQKQLLSLRYIATAGSIVTKYMRQRTKGFCQLMEILYADTWAQTETGSCLFTTPPSHFDLPDGRMIPFLGIDAAVVDRDFYLMDLSRESQGHLAIRMPWPALFSRLLKSKPALKGGIFYTGDNAVRHPDNTFVIQGRQHNSTVAVVCADDHYQRAVIQLESVEEVLEKDDCVQEAILCHYTLDTSVDSCIMAVIKRSKELNPKEAQNLEELTNPEELPEPCSERSDFGEAQEPKSFDFNKEFASFLNLIVWKELHIGNRCPGKRCLLSPIVISKKRFSTTTCKKDRLKIEKAAKRVAELIDKQKQLIDKPKELTGKQKELPKKVTGDYLKEVLKQKELLDDEELEVIYSELNEDVGDKCATDK